MAPQQRVARERLGDFLGHSDVGEQHELLDQRVGLLEVVHLDVRRVLRLRVELETHTFNHEKDEKEADAIRHGGKSASGNAMASSIASGALLGRVHIIARHMTVYHTATHSDEHADT